MKNASQTPRSLAPAKAFLIAVCAFLAVPSTAFGQQQIDMAAGRYDLLRAHNERVIVSFGRTLDFKRYSVVEILHQHFVVAAEVRGGVRYNLHGAAGHKTLVIE